MIRRYHHDSASSTVRLPPATHHARTSSAAAARPTSILHMHLMLATLPRLAKPGHRHLALCTFVARCVAATKSSASRLLRFADGVAIQPAIPLNPRTSVYRRPDGRERQISNPTMFRNHYVSSPAVAEPSQHSSRSFVRKHTSGRRKTHPAHLELELRSGAPQTQLHALQHLFVQLCTRRHSPESLSPPGRFALGVARRRSPKSIPCLSRVATFILFLPQHVSRTNV